MSMPGRLVLLGHPVHHSLSPRFQNAALDEAGIPVRYEAIDVPPGALPALLNELRASRAAGNVTIPHKQRVFEASDVLTPLAARAGAVNTFWMEDDRLVGDNTDVGGFAAAAVRLLGAAPSGLTIGVIGAGGAAAAVLTAIEGWDGCRAIVFNRTPSRAEQLCARFQSVARCIDDARDLVRAQLVVNATSIGLRDNALPLDPTLLALDAGVLDLVYRPGETAWVRAARGRGHRALDGLPMLVEQGALAFERWFGRSPNREVMWRAVSDPSS
jgi:shikimate dehydrogenase